MHIVILRLAIPLKTIMIKIWIWAELSDVLRIKVSPTCSKTIILALFLYMADLLNDCFSNHVEKAPLQIWEYSYCIWGFFSMYVLFWISHEVFCSSLFLIDPSWYIWKFIHLCIFSTCKGIFAGNGMTITGILKFQNYSYAYKSEVEFFTIANS